MHAFTCSFTFCRMRSVPGSSLVRKKLLRVVPQFGIAESARHLRQANRGRRIHLLQNSREVVPEQLPRRRLRFIILEHAGQRKHVSVLHLVARHQVKRLLRQLRFGKGA